ncbi:MAG: hypothetical protein AAF182_01370 [Pseudomonadota bacterium]
MSAIKQALINLDNVIGKLENSITEYQRATNEQVETVKVEAKKQAEAAAKVQAQADMFSEVDPSLVAKKLDSAIQKVESVLESA